MEVEILGILGSMAGPKSDVILARLHGAKAEYTGVVAGMSGSPVYIDGKLVGAIAYRMASSPRSQSPASLPVANMLEINELDKLRWRHRATAATAAPEATRTSGPGIPSAPMRLPSATPNLLKPIDTPLVFSGFREDTMRMLPRISPLRESCR